MERWETGSLRGGYPDQVPGDCKHAVSADVPSQHPTPWTVLRLWGQRVGTGGGFPNSFLAEKLTLAEADGC